MSVRIMDIDLFFKKIYTVAFRLTGEEQFSEEISSQAIIHTFKEMNEDYKVTENMIHLAVIELIKIFLSNPIPISHSNNNLKGIKRAILELKPINRVVVVWKDVLGYEIHDNIPISDYTYEGLYK
jgi:hypothetical protein